ncbi:hypothetical protein BCR34DRAFT_457742, partial [Clohesyomyces aquaticus]
STIRNAGDATALASCSTFTGHITIATGVPDQVALNGIRQITGNFEVSSNPDLVILASNTLEKIGGRFMLDTVAALRTVNFTKLTSVDTITWYSVPRLEEIGLDAGVDVAQKVEIQDTNLTEIRNFNIKSTELLYIQDNEVLRYISILLNNVGSVNIGRNYPKIQVEMPNLTWANNVTIHDVSSVLTPVLSHVNQTFGLYSSPLHSLDLSSLRTVDGLLSVSRNPNITNLKLTSLQSVGGLQILNNSALGTLFFDNLANISGDVSIGGDFSNISMQALRSDTGGYFTIDATNGSTFNCEPFDKYHSNRVIEGVYQCHG